MTQHERDENAAKGGISRERFEDTKSESVDVSSIHFRIVSREQNDPEEGLEPPPWWLWAFGVLLLFAMGFYIGRFGGSFSATAHEVEEPQAAGFQTVKEEVRGDQVYTGICQACHQWNGSGVTGQYPALAGSEWLLGPKDIPVRIVLHGLTGPITVKGASYNNRMPPFHDKLSSEEIAAALSYARSSWGNRAPVVLAADVDSVRAKFGTRDPWTAHELQTLVAGR